MSGDDPSPIDVFAVLDFEATCDDVTKIIHEVIEFPVVLVDAHTLETLEEHRTFVRPIHNPVLTPFCTNLTGITQDDVKDAPSFAEALHLHETFMAKYADKKILYVTCGDWDLKTMLPLQLQTSGIVPKNPKAFASWCNIKNLFMDHTGIRVKGMPSMLAHCGLELIGRHHSGIDDCRNIARILVSLIRSGAVGKATWHG